MGFMTGYGLAVLLLIQLFHFCELGEHINVKMTMKFLDKMKRTKLIIFLNLNLE